MGAGKSTIGRLLAKELRLPFKDSDKEIELRTGANIPWIFDKEGEPGFRDREQAMIAELCAFDGVVLATGAISVPHAVAEVERLAPVVAFLADGESWSSSALALALGTSQRTVQRALDSLAAAGAVQSLGRGRSRRWTGRPRGVA